MQRFDVRRLWRKARWRFPTAIPLALMALLVVVFVAAAHEAGLTAGLWPNLLLNGAGDLMGGIFVLMMIEPMVRRAAIQVRPRGDVDFARYLHRLHAAREDIMILDSSTEIFMIDNVRARRELVNAARRGVHVRVLLMMPFGAAAELRKQQLFPNRPDLQLSREINANIRELREVQDQLVRSGVEAGRFEFRLYESAVTFTLYTIDDEMTFGLAPASEFTFASSQLEILGSSVSGRTILDNFEEIWRSAVPVLAEKPIVLHAGGRPVLSPFVMYRRMDFYTNAVIANSSGRVWIPGPDGEDVDAASSTWTPPPVCTAI